MLTYLCGICTALFVGSYVSGWLPLAFSLSEARMKRIAVLGAGLLVGTALSVIIPEGLYSVYSAQAANSAKHDHDEHQKGEHPSGMQNALNKNLEAEVHEHEHDHEHGGDIHSHGEGHAIVGFVLVCGFVFMLAIDQLSGGHSHNHSHGAAGGGANAGAGQSAVMSSPIAIAIPAGSSAGPQGAAAARKNQKMTATLGLVVHACADGLAMGAALTSHSRQLEMLVFFAIMLHKSPEAFGLVTFLLHEGFERRRILRHLFVVSVTAPLFALLTYAAVAFTFGLGSGGTPSTSASVATGLALLFSAGTFLYVATVHVLPEILHDMAANASACHSNPLAGRVDLLIVLAGAFLPALLTSHLAH